MNLKEKFKNKLKKLSGVLQKPTSSYNDHEMWFQSPDVVEQERKLALEKEDSNTFNKPEFRVLDLLAKYPAVRGVAVDIGSGAGWFSYKFSGYFQKVIAIEPSAKAVEICKELYPPQKYQNIEWRQGFAENVLSGLKLNTPALFFTGVVLSHLRDKEVIKICAAVNSLALPGSILDFSECWGQESHQIMWHVRTKEWWQSQLPGWELDFHGPIIQDTPGRHKGFFGVKVK